MSVRPWSSKVVVSALVSVTASALGLVGGSRLAEAQTAVDVSNIGVVLRTSGPVAAGVTGFRADVSCENPVGSGPLLLTATFGSFGGSTTLPFRLQSAAAGGTTCRLRVTPQGTAQLNVSYPDMSIGSQALAPLTTKLDEVTTGVYSYTSPPVVLSAGASFRVSFAYPQMVVRKVVQGDETQPGAAYPMEAACTRADGSSVQPRSVIDPTAFNGRFSLKKDEVRSIGLAEFPLLSAADVCSIREIDSLGANGTYSSSRPAGADGVRPKPLDGVTIDGQYRSAPIAANGETVTVTNSFVGDLQITKVVTGPPQSNIAIYELSIACDKGGPVERFLLKDRQTKLFPNIISDTTCVVVEPRSDGARVSYTDNSGQPDDGTVHIELSPVGCRDQRFAGVADCRASVIVTNTYADPASAPTTTGPPAPAVAAAAAPAAAPTVVPEAVAAPATPVSAEPNFTG